MSKKIARLSEPKEWRDGRTDFTLMWYNEPTIAGFSSKRGTRAHLVNFAKRNGFTHLFFGSGDPKPISEF